MYSRVHIILVFWKHVWTSEHTMVFRLILCAPLWTMVHTRKLLICNVHDRTQGVTFPRRNWTRRRSSHTSPHGCRRSRSWTEPWTVKTRDRTMHCQGTGQSPCSDQFKKAWAGWRRRNPSLFPSCHFASRDWSTLFAFQNNRHGWFPVDWKLQVQYFCCVPDEHFLCWDTPAVGGSCQYDASSTDYVHRLNQAGSGVLSSRDDNHEQSSRSSLTEMPRCGVLPACLAEALRSCLDAQVICCLCHCY